MGLSPLENLAQIGQLKSQPSNDGEVARLLSMARVRLADARLTDMSQEGRFSSAYTAAHAAAVAALRRQGFRSDNRYLVFQCLEHSVGWPAARWRILAAAHAKRNRVEYEGFVDVDASDIEELVAIAEALITEVEGLTRRT
jgi:hypothetical protein